jgi:tRNA(Arg) A34 adenosine deaminase TadA
MCEQRKPAGAIRIDRRAVLAGLAAAGVGAGASAADAKTKPIQPLNDPGPRAFMRRAEQMRDLAGVNGDQGFGAVIVKGNKIVGQAPSRVVTNKDPTAHAEVEAIRDAARRLGTRDLSGCVMYGTFKACAMCETAAYWAQLDRLYHGSAITDGGKPKYGGC